MKSWLGKMAYYPNNDMVLTWHNMMMICHQGGVPFLLMWHFKMPREQKVTFQGIFGKRSYYHSSDILSIQFKHTRILRIFEPFFKYFKILYTKANFQAFVFL
jgi:hypothetical protein